MKKESPKMGINSLVVILVSNKVAIQSIDIIDYGIQFILEDDLKVNWFHKEGRTVVQGKKSDLHQRLQFLINSN